MNPPNVLLGLFSLFHPSETEHWKSSPVSWHRRGICCVLTNEHLLVLTNYHYFHGSSVTFVFKPYLIVKTQQMPLLCQDTGEPFQCSVSDGWKSEKRPADWAGQKAAPAVRAHHVTGVTLVNLAGDSVPAHRALQTVLDTPDQISALVVTVRLLPGLLRTLGVT